MSLKIFEQELKNECQRLYSDLRDGSRQERLLKNKGNSLMDIVSVGKNNNKIFRSCIITFGNALERATMNYAEQMKATRVYKEKRFLAAVRQKKLWKLYKENTGLYPTHWIVKMRVGR